MIYINKNKDLLEKYEVTYDKKEINKLLERFVKKCGEKHKKSYEVYDIPTDIGLTRSYSFYKEDKIKYKETISVSKTGKTKTLYDDYYPYQTEIYNYEYFEYIVPNFVNYISKLLTNPEEIIPLIFNQDFKEIEHFPTINEKIKTLNLEIEKIKEDFIRKMEINNKIKNLNSISSIKEILLEEKNYCTIIEEKEKELKELLSLKELNPNQELIAKYIEELNSLITFKLIDTLNISETKRINSFFEEEIIIINDTNSKRLTRKTIKYSIT